MARTKKTLDAGDKTSNGLCLPRFTEALKRRFLQHLSESCNITASARKIGMSRHYMHQVRREDKKFAAGWADAVEQATDNLEATARGRAMDGYQRPVYQRGKLVGHETVYSDRMTELLLKAHRPEKFREKGFDLPPGSEIVIALRSAPATEADTEVKDVIKKEEKVLKITD